MPSALGAKGLWPCLAWLLLAWPIASMRQTMKFVIVSAPRLAKVSYVTVGSFGSNTGLTATDLITTGLAHPQGLVVDQARNKLYVADPDNSQIMGYTLAQSGGTLTASTPSVVSASVQARWVGVDSSGNVFFSDEANNKIYKVPAVSVLRGSTAGGVAPTPQVVYDGNAITGVSAPGGVVVDNFYLYWTNKAAGKQVGTVVRGAEIVPGNTQQADSAAVLARNLDKSYGICLALDNLFYTDSTKKVYGIKKTGSGGVVEVSDALQEPRGCSWDGDGTVYVADRGANKVWSFASNMKAINTVQMDPAFDLDDAFGIAVFVRQ